MMNIGPRRTRPQASTPGAPRHDPEGTFGPQSGDNRAESGSIGQYWAATGRNGQGAEMQVVGKQHVVVLDPLSRPISRMRAFICRPRRGGPWPIRAWASGVPARYPGGIVQNPSILYATPPILSVVVRFCPLLSAAMRAETRKCLAYTVIGILACENKALAYGLRLNCEAALCPRPSTCREAGGRTCWQCRSTKRHDLAYGGQPSMKGEGKAARMSKLPRTVCAQGKFRGPTCRPGDSSRLSRPLSEPVVRPPTRGRAA